MKKITLLFATAVFVLTSCTKDKTDSVATTAGSGLLKKLTVDGYPMIFTYDDSKIIKTEETSYVVNYTYTGDLITLAASVDDVEYGDKFFNNIEYTYENGKLISDLTKINDGSNGTTMKNAFKSEYTYNADGIVSVQEYAYNNNTFGLDRRSTLTFQNGNLVKEQRFYLSGETYTLATYEYDTKINPFKKILGRDKLLDPESASANNILKSTFIYGPSDNKITDITTSVYTYTSDGYPLTRKSTTITTQGTNAPKTTTSSAQYEY